MIDYRNSSLDTNLNMFSVRREFENDIRVLHKKREDIVLNELPRMTEEEERDVEDIERHERHEIRELIHSDLRRSHMYSQVFRDAGIEIIRCRRCRNYLFIEYLANPNTESVWVGRIWEN